MSVTCCSVRRFSCFEYSLLGFIALVSVEYPASLIPHAVPTFTVQIRTDHRGLRRCSQAVVVSIDPRRVYVSDPSSTKHTCVPAAKPGPNGEQWCWWQCTVKVRGNCRIGRLSTRGLGAFVLCRRFMQVTLYNATSGRMLVHTEGQCTSISQFAAP